MRIKAPLQLASLFLGLVGLTAAELSKHDSSEVIVLGDETHGDFVKSANVALVKYFAPCIEAH